MGFLLHDLSLSWENLPWFIAFLALSSPITIYYLKIAFIRIHHHGRLMHSSTPDRQFKDIELLVDIILLSSSEGVQIWFSLFCRQTSTNSVNMEMRKIFDCVEVQCVWHEIYICSRNTKIALKNNWNFKITRKLIGIVRVIQVNSNKSVGNMCKIFSKSYRYIHYLFIYYLQEIKN